MRIPECHPNKRYGARGMCALCYNTWLRKTNPVYAQSCKESSRRLGQTEKAKLKRKDCTLRLRYGISLEQRDAMAKAQNYHCLICDRKKLLVVDHRHSDGKVRGLVCHRCNLLVGALENNMDLLPHALQYVCFNHIGDFNKQEKRSNYVI